ncbi:thiamine pyrophosphokinase [Pararhodonellum marinum]|uniref:thiamine pyrophosphokinase n=1 Tax=Pararhodonellum marinum TaxID=2755358 RepID=UPI0018900468|nr:thiamine pyrophosphokinase [Pararhodonellum marinum]
MSSHHFVKEQQEPALLVLDTEGIGFEKVGALLEWVPTVLVAENALETVQAWGIKIDVILAPQDFQSTHLQLLEEQYPVRFLTVTENRFLEEGLHYLLASKHHAVNLVGYDHQKTPELSDFLPLMDLVFFDGPMRYFPAKNGQIKKWFPKGSIQLHAPENSLIEIKSPDQSQVIQIQHATFIDLEEGHHILTCQVPFWVGEFLE